jgi:hypothetical protein
MAIFLSDEWFDELATAAASAATVDPALDLVLQQVVELDDGELSWWVAARDGRLEVGRGRHADPTVTFFLDASTAQGVQSGGESPQAAFMAGRLRVGGDVRVLLEQQEGLAALDDVFATVRAATVYAVSVAGA